MEYLLRDVKWEGCQRRGPIALKSLEKRGVNQMHTAFLEGPRTV